MDYWLFQIYWQIKYYLAHVYQFKTCVTLKLLVKFTDLISILSCLKIIFLLILLQSSHWISRYNIDNLWQYFIFLDFAVSVILSPYEMRSRLFNQFYCLNYIHINSLTGLGDLAETIIILLKFGSLSPNVTLKNRSVSYKLNQLLIV